MRAVGSGGGGWHTQLLPAGAPACVARARPEPPLGHLPPPARGARRAVRGERRPGRARAPAGAAAAAGDAPGRPQRAAVRVLRPGHLGAGGAAVGQLGAQPGEVQRPGRWQGGWRVGGRRRGCEACRRRRPVGGAAGVRRVPAARACRVCLPCPACSLPSWCVCARQLRTRPALAARPPPPPPRAARGSWR